MQAVGSHPHVNLLCIQAWAALRIDLGVTLRYFAEVGMVLFDPGHCLSCSDMFSATLPCSVVNLRGALLPFHVGAECVVLPIYAGRGANLRRQPQSGSACFRSFG